MFNFKTVTENDLTHTYAYAVNLLCIVYNNLTVSLVVAIWLHKVHYDNGVYIIRQFARGDTFYIIAKGKVSNIHA